MCRLKLSSHKISCLYPKATYLKLEKKEELNVVARIRGYLGFLIARILVHNANTANTIVTGLI